MDRYPEVRLVAVTEGHERRICLHFDPDDTIEALTATLPGRSWSKELHSWSVLNNPENLRLIFRVFRGKAYINTEGVFGPKERQVVTEVRRKETGGRSNPAGLLPPLPQDTKRKLYDFEKRMRQMRYSENTIRTYTGGVATFFRYCHDKDLAMLSNEDLQAFNYGFVLKNHYSSSWQNQVINAVKLFYRKMERREMILEEIERPRKEMHLPNVLSKEEVKRILGAPVNLKHRAMLGLIYACGLRRSELINLKPADIESSRGLLVVRQSKGNKDRVVPISPKVVEMLREYFKAYRPKEWLFEGRVAGEHYSSTSLQEVLKKCVLKAGIRKPVTLHWLRHSYATHLLESGTDLRFIQELLGHKSSRTTEIYTHVSQKSIQQIRSPFDDL